METMQHQDWITSAYRIIRALALSTAPAEKDVIVTYGFPPIRARACMVRTPPEGTGYGAEYQIFISPDEWLDPPTLIATLAHEMVHCCMSREEGHGPRFWEMCVEYGIPTGPPYVEYGAKFRPVVDAVLAALGPPPPGGAPLFAPVSDTDGNGEAKHDGEAKREGEGSKHGRGSGSGKGSRLKLFECGCTPPWKIRSGRSDLMARCTRCQVLFVHFEEVKP